MRWQFLADFSLFLLISRFRGRPRCWGGEGGEGKGLELELYIIPLDQEWLLPPLYI